MDSRQSLEFIERLIKEAQTNPEIRKVLKNATLKLAATQPTIQGIDDGHLENLFSMTVNRGGMSMFLKAMDRVFADKSVSKAEKDVVIQAHPHHLRDVKKFFSSVIPFQIDGLSAEITHWDQTVETKKNNNPVGFYNEIDALVDYLKKVGFSAPFKIEAKKKGLVLTHIDEDLDKKILFDKLMADIKQVHQAMGDVESRLEDLVKVDIQIDELDDAIKEKEIEIRVVESERNTKLRERTKLEAELKETPPTMDDKENPRFKEITKEIEELTKEMEALWKKMKKMKEELTKTQGLLKAAKIKYDELYNQEEKDLVSQWRAVNWDGSTQLTEKQIDTFMGILGNSKYDPLKGSLPYKKTTKVSLSCVVKSSSSGYDQATFKHLKNFIKFSVR